MRPPVARKLPACVLLVAVLTVLGLGWPAVASATAAANCQTIRLSQAVGLPLGQSVAASYCQPTTPTDAVDLLVHGGTYNRQYWDPDSFPERSYVRQATQAGRATLAIDVLGTGESSQPLSLTVTLDQNMQIVHHLIGWLRGQGYDTVNLLGHSFGSIMGIYETAAYNDADRLVVTGIMHGLASDLGLSKILPKLYPAATDPKYLGRLLDPGYLTTLPGVRRDAFMTPDADPSLVAWDEAHKDVVSATEAAQAVAQLEIPVPALNVSARIHRPVLVVIGEEDNVFCRTLVDCTGDGEAVARPSSRIVTNEAPWYPNAASLTAYGVQHTGHDVTLQSSGGRHVLSGTGKRLRVSRPGFIRRLVGLL